MDIVREEEKEELCNRRDIEPLGRREQGAF